MAKGRKMKEIVIGEMTFPEVIDITDPCYDKHVWCRMNDVNIHPGDYECVVWRQNNIVGIIGIYLDGTVPAQNAMEEIGEIGVDAGLAGFFTNKPDYSQEEWTAFCNRTWSSQEKTWAENNAWIFDEGFFSSSGDGDGCYPVYARMVDGKAVALEIRFA